ncbi:uncharacterized protein RNJ42_03918 [Nakaseomyces bracarensis]
MTSDPYLPAPRFYIFFLFFHFFLFFIKTSLSRNFNGQTNLYKILSFFLFFCLLLFFF